MLPPNLKEKLKSFRKRMKMWEKLKVVFTLLHFFKRENNFSVKRKKPKLTLQCIN